MSQTPNFLIAGDKLSISCAVSYNGLLAPDFIWHPTPDNILPLVNTSSSVTSTAEVIAPSSGSVQSYTCYVMFYGSVFAPAANQTSTPVDISGNFIYTHFIAFTLSTVYCNMYYIYLNMGRTSGLRCRSLQTFSSNTIL